MNIGQDFFDTQYLAGGVQRRQQSPPCVPAGPRQQNGFPRYIWPWPGPCRLLHIIYHVSHNKLQLLDR